MEPNNISHTGWVPTSDSTYHKYGLDLLTDGFQQYGVKPTKLGQATSKQIYAEYTKHALSESKVTDTFLQVNFLADVWPRLYYGALTARPRQAVLDSVHGLVRNRVRLV